VTLISMMIVTLFFRRLARPDPSTHRMVFLEDIGFYIVLYFDAGCFTPAALRPADVLGLENLNANFNPQSDRHRGCLIGNPLSSYQIRIGGTGEKVC
jgi:hypothetical protein